MASVVLSTDFSDLVSTSALTRLSAVGAAVSGASGRSSFASSLITDGDRREVAQSAMKWIISLPNWVRPPSVGFGDDGSVSFEWERDTATLHVMFAPYGSEAYFADDESGDEWESALDAAHDKLFAAFVRVSPAGHLLPTAL